MAIETSFQQEDGPQMAGLYREDTFLVTSSQITDIPTICHRMDRIFRNKRHHRAEYQYGIEFALNLTTTNFVTRDIKRIDTSGTQPYNSTITFAEGYVSDNDVILLGYYCSGTGSAEPPGHATNDYSVPRRVDIAYAEWADTLNKAVNLGDRLDFAETFTFPSDSVEYILEGKMLWNSYAGDPDPLSIERNRKRTIFQFNSEETGTNRCTTTFPVADGSFVPVFLTAMNFTGTVDVINDDDAASANYEDAILFDIYINDNLVKGVATRRTDMAANGSYWSADSVEERYGSLSSLIYVPGSCIDHTESTVANHIPPAITYSVKGTATPNTDTYGTTIFLGNTRAFSIKVDAYISSTVDGGIAESTAWYLWFTGWRPTT